MTDPVSFHEVRFPIDVAFGSTGGPKRQTEIVALGSGHEERNTRWADSRRHYDAGYGVKSLADIHDILSFYEERRGQLYGFRFRDPMDYLSCRPGETVAADDQEIGIGDGLETDFQLIKTYGSTFAPYARDISKPVTGSVILAVDGVPQASGWSVDETTGLVSFTVPPLVSSVISAGYEFDVPVRFDADQLVIDIGAFQAGSVPQIPIVEIRI